MKTLLRLSLLVLLVAGLYVGVTTSSASAMHVPSPLPIPGTGTAR